MAIVLFTDFGGEGPYIGQMESVIDSMTPDARVIHLLSNAPTANPLLSSYLLAALSKSFPRNTIFLAVVDPGVGGQRAAVVLEADGQFFVGPDNGLLNTVAVQSRQYQWFEIIWCPENCSNSFHGRDIFAPIASRLHAGSVKEFLQPITIGVLSDWPADLQQIIYFDHFGNAMTGIRYQEHFDGQSLLINGIEVKQADTFCAVNESDVFWYKNSSGLIEIAANKQNIQIELKLTLADDVIIPGG